MSIRRILLPVVTFPDPVPERAFEGACAMAQTLGAGLTAHLSQLNPDASTWPPVVGAFPLDFPQAMQEMVIRSEANAAAAVQALDRAAGDFGVSLDLRRTMSALYESAEPLVSLARLHDLTILPVPETDCFQRAWTEGVLFGAGRPVLLLPSRGKRLRWLDRIVVAWDWSREAARALADAMPILSQAKEVHVVTIFGEKPIAPAAPVSDLDKFLSAHRINYQLVRVELAKKSIGECLMHQAENHDADMLVMGGYGHSRTREMVLGGATREILREPLLPVFLSH